uniref:Uncharacterized protein n=1 Tax=Anguilla anguilla TaxID=7936 RepID=A0A0E9U7V9_ANGAN
MVQLIGSTANRRRLRKSSASS